MPAKHTLHTEEEVLLAFAVESVHDRETLERYLKEFPEHASALVDCSIAFFVEVSPSGEVALNSEVAVEHAWQQFQANVEQPDDAAPINPFAQLSPTAFKSLAARLDISKLMLARLRDRAIDAATIPRRFVNAMSNELGTNAEAFMAYLRLPPAMVSSHSFRSAVKPGVAEPMSFETAVETSHLTPAQQAALKALRK